MHKLVMPLELLLRATAVVCVLLAGLWILGPNGTGTISPDDVPGTDRGVGGPALSGWAIGPTSQVYLVKREERDQLWDVSTEMGMIQNGVAPPNYAEVHFGAVVQFLEPSSTYRFLYAALNVLTWLGIGALWWMLAVVLRSSRQESPFTTHNARRLGIIGVVVLVGGIVHSVVQALLLRQMVESSSQSERVDPLTYGFYDLPWGSIAVGIGVLAVAHVWRRGVALEHDLKGLV